MRQEQNDLVTVAVVFTDSSCERSRGPGEWSAAIRQNGRETTLAGHGTRTTKNWLTLQATVAALEHLKEPSSVVVLCENRYLLRGATQLLRWSKRNGWVTAGNTPVVQDDLWRRFDKACRHHDVTLNWFTTHRRNTWMKPDTGRRPCRLR
jgi:ribonuclease HI